MSHETKRITILFSELSGYMLACWKELKVQKNIELQVFYWKPASQAPFDLDLNSIDHAHSREKEDAQSIYVKVKEFNPHIVCMAGWMDKGYLEVARKMKGQGIPVVATLDNPWQGTLRQRMAIVVAPRYLHSAIDILWVAGDRQAQFARKLGYRGAKLLYGLYCCDWEKFSHQPAEIDSNEKSFLYVGRYNAQEKALDLLVNAYTQYRNKVQQPWKLTCAGAGEMKQLLAGQTGIVDMGFTQPDALPALMRVHGAFILPSRKEPWGVVLQEAAASSLPLICSDACGGSVHLLQDGYNGYVFGSNDIEHLAQCMVKMTELNNKERSEMGRRSHELARQFTPQRWAATLIQGLLDYS